MTTEPDDLYRALLTSGRLPQMRRLTYRCATPARCLLLDAVETPMGILLHQRRFKQSHEVNARRSSPGGREANTTDGDRHWMPRTYWIGQSALNWPEDAGGQDLTCDHVGVTDNGGSVLLRSSAFHSDWDARHAVVLIRPDGSRLV